MLPFGFQAIADHSLTLAWEPNPEEDIACYVVYYGLGSRHYPYSTNVGNVTTATINGLLENQTYYFAITAISTAALESEFSNEVTNAFVYVVPYVTLYVQESSPLGLHWTNIWSIDRLVNTTNYVYRVQIGLPPYTNRVPYIGDYPVIIEEVPPLPTVAP